MTHLKPGVELEITARAYFESASADMSSLVQLSPETLKEREEASAAQEEVIYDEAQAVIKNGTHRLRRRSITERPRNI